MWEPLEFKCGQATPLPVLGLAGCLTSSVVQNAAHRSLPATSKLVWYASPLHTLPGPVPLAFLCPLLPAHTAHLTQPSYCMSPCASAPVPERNLGHILKEK